MAKKRKADTRTSGKQKNVKSGKNTNQGRNSGNAGKRGSSGNGNASGMNGQNAYNRNMQQKKKKKGSGSRIVGVIMLVIILVLLAIMGLVAYNEKISGLNNNTAEENAELDASAVVTATPEPTPDPAELERLAQEQAEKEAAEKAAAEQAAKDALYAAHPELKTKITYQLPTGDVVLDEETIITWLVDNGDGTYTKDNTRWTNSISTYVTNMANSVDTLGDSRTFNATGLGERTIAGSQYYGWKVDREKEIEKLKAELEAGQESTREPEYSKREMAKADDNYGIGGDYCEVDASRQHLWIYKNYQVALETDVVTGLMDQTHYTPEGTYLLFGKEQHATLKGDVLPNGARSYETPVDYWMPFTDTGIGLHDAYWKSVFGKGENWYNGSHGCVNLPAEIAPQVYELMTTEMPIIVYYSEEYTLAPAPVSEWDQYLIAQQAAAEQKAKEDAENKEDSEEDSEDKEDGDSEEPTPEPTPEPTEEPYEEPEPTEEPYEEPASEPELPDPNNGDQYQGEPAAEENVYE